MTKLKIVHVPKVHQPKAFSSHPGHGGAAQTAASFAKDVQNNQKVFPGYPQMAAQERMDHISVRRSRG